MVRISKGHKEVVIKNGLSLLESDAMLSPVACIFIRIPVESHGVIIETFYFAVTTHPLWRGLPS